MQASNQEISRIVREVMVDVTLYSTMSFQSSNLGLPGVTKPCSVLITLPLGNSGAGLEIDAERR